MQTDGSTRWPTVARDAEVDRALAALDDAGEVRGVAVVGESGAGKSTLARMVADAVESRGCPVRFVLGTQTGMAVPLGAFSRVVTVDTAHELAGMLAAAHTALAQQDNLVIVVDDAQLLDPLSAILVYQLAADRAARLVVTIRSGVDVPDAVSTLVKERWLCTLAVEPFTREQTGELARAVLEDAVEDRLVDELYRRTKGNPLLLRGLLSPGRDSGALRRTESGWRLHGSLAPDQELVALLEFRLRSLDPDERAVIEVLAVAELLDWQMLRELCDPGAAERMERAGMIQLSADGPDTLAQLNHAVIGEAAIRLAGVVRSRKLNGLLAQAYQKALAQDRRRLRLSDDRGLIRMAQFAMRSDLEPDPGLTLRAAETALTLANLAAGEELARFAFDHGGGLPAGLILADALHWRGRSDDAEEILAGFDPDGSDALLTAQWAAIRATNLFDGCGQVDAARELLVDARRRIEPDPAVELITAVQTACAFYSGDFVAAIKQGLPLCTSDAYPLAVAWAGTATSWALTLSGRNTELDQVAAAVYQATAVGPSGLQRLFVGLAQAVAMAGTGELSTAQRMLAGFATLTAGVAEAQAAVAQVAGYVQMLCGALDTAGASLQSAVSVLSAGFQNAVFVLAASWCAQTEGARGDAEAAGVALRCAEAVYGTHTAAFLPELELGRAWVYAAAGQTSPARRHAVCAARAARQRGADVVEMHALHTAVRFGDRAHAVRLAELTQALAAPLAEAIAAHARGVAEHDGDLLDAAAERFVELGALALAADAAAQAATAHERKGSLVHGLQSAARARSLADQTGLRSPAIAAITVPLPITAREREIAVLVEQGLSNPAIADRLGVSLRTIEGHLYRVFAKLGVENRRQLAHLMAAVGSSS